MPSQPAFEQIVELHQQMVFRTLARLLGPGTQQCHLEDLAQDVFLRLFRALPSFRGDSQITTYLYRVAVNVAHDECSRRRREDRQHLSLADQDLNLEGRLEHPGMNAIEQLEAHEFAELVEEHLARLSSAERSVLILFHQEDRTYDQIAGELAIPINTVRTHLHRARKKLRDGLAISALASKKVAP